MGLSRISQTVKSIRLTGSVVLAFAKVSITKFHHNFVNALQRFGDELDYADWVCKLREIVTALVLTDTDSVCYQVFCIFADKLPTTTDEEVSDFI